MKKGMEKMNRSAAREETFKLLYSLEVQKENLKEQTEMYLENAEISDENTKKYMNETVEGIEKNLTEIEDKISENLKKDWKIDRISKINLVLLKLAIYEILYTETPFKVVPFVLPSSLRKYWSLIFCIIAWCLLANLLSTTTSLSVLRPMVIFVTNSIFFLLNIK
jgi:N utilization substance protein B